MKRHLARALWLCVAGAAAVCPARDAAADNFDGNWTVYVVCESFREAQGYSWTFPAAVTGGNLHGVYGLQGSPNSFDLSGTIAADGTAKFLGKGLTGNPQTTLGAVASGQPFSYHAVGNFAGSRGQAKRVEARPCTLTFTRQ